MLHEVSHNLQNDLGLARAIPRASRGGCCAAGLPAVRRGDLDTLEPRDLRRPERPAARRPGRRRLADGRHRPRAATRPRLLSPRGPHPTPYLRTLHQHRAAAPHGVPRRGASATAATWQPDLSRPAGRHHPAARARVLRGGQPRCRGHRSASGRSRARRQQPRRRSPLRAEGAADGRGGGAAARERDRPGVVPERFLIGAARVALDRRSRAGRPRGRLLHGAARR